MQAEIGGLIRTLAATMAGLIVSHGWATQDQAQAIAGGVVALLVAAWSVWQKRTAKNK